MKQTVFLLLSAAAFLLLSCQTVPSDIPEDLTPMEYFQLGQEEFERNNLLGSLAYYETFIERFPSDYANRVVAEYWVANINRKQGNSARALELFQDLLAKEDELRGRVPEWPFVLSRDFVEELQPD